MTSIFGTEQADTLEGDSLSNTISGLAGDDSIEAFEGDDTVFGNQGADIIRVLDGNNVVFGGEGDDVVNSEIGFRIDEEGFLVVYESDNNDLIFGNLGGDILRGGMGDDTIFGGKDNDLIFGEDGRDRIFGDLGDDSISGVGIFGDGGGDVDTLTGGPGADIFTLGLTPTIPYYSELGDDDYALITDFNSSEGDTLRIGNDSFEVQNITLPDLGTGAGIFLIIDGRLELNSFLQGVDANSLNIPSPGIIT